MTDAPPAPDIATPFRYTAVLASEIERSCQERWEADDVYRTCNPGDEGFDPARRKFYCLDMFPYPSGKGLHVGHPVGYIGSDIICRYRRMRGDNVLHPMGWDAFGLPAEQYAIQTGVHPSKTTMQAIDTYRQQLKRIGFSYDWSREFATIDPAYYRWTQWIWLQAYNAWFDPVLRKARTIADLTDRLTSGALLVSRDGEPVPVSESGPGTHDWSELDPASRRLLVDSQRLAFLSEQVVNWCPKLGTALANEEVIDGRSIRGSHPVTRRPLKQWMFRITAYADRLLDGLEDVNWPESTRAMQNEWIGRSEGAEIDFPLASPLEGSLKVYTTRPDTIFGATFMVIAPEHPLATEICDRLSGTTEGELISSCIEASRHRSDVDRIADTDNKYGVSTGSHAVNPANGESIPIWIADFVLMGYGHGAIMAVPAHDERDHAFALAHDLPIAAVVRPPDGTDPGPCYTGVGIGINSSSEEIRLDELNTPDAIMAMTAWLETTGRGKATVNYRLRDWLFSRQRYWGEPFPIVYDEDGQHYPVGEQSLPVTLPPLDDYQPVESDEPVPLLDKATGWIHTTAGEAGVDPAILPPETPVRRETNTMPGWAGSCWYYIRYCDPHNERDMISPECASYWLAPGRDMKGSVDLYIGGSEHAVLHLLYARFWHMILHDLGYLETSEPFSTLFHQGLITAFSYQREDTSHLPFEEVDAMEDGEFIERATGEPVQRVVAKMSKSLGNVVNPDEIISEYSSDTFRLYEMYMGPLEASKPWNTRDIVGVFRFLQRLWRLIVCEETNALRLCPTSAPTIERALNRTMQKVSRDIERMSFNTAIAALIEFVNTATAAEAGDGILTRDQVDRLLRILSPFAPHLADELFLRIGGDGFIGHCDWPEYDESLLAHTVLEIPVQIGGKVRGRISVPADADETAQRDAALSDERIAGLLVDMEIHDVIVVPGKIINIVTK